MPDIILKKWQRHNDLAITVNDAALWLLKVENTVLVLRLEKKGRPYENNCANISNLTIFFLKGIYLNACLPDHNLNLTT